jgi:hypothetical protein
LNNKNNEQNNPNFASHAAQSICEARKSEGEEIAQLRAKWVSGV